MRMRKMKRKKYGNAEERAELLVRVGCLLFLLVMTRICVAAGEPLPDAEQISLPDAEEMAEKTTVRIVLRPEKQEGEPDPDLTEEIRRQICAQVGEDPELAGRLCACVDWTYTYDDKILPPGETRGPGESDIFRLLRMTRSMSLRDGLSRRRIQIRRSPGRRRSLQTRTGSESRRSTQSRKSLWS